MPSSRTKLAILLQFLRLLIVSKKNEEHWSPSLSHWNLDFCLAKLSSALARETYILLIQSSLSWMWKGLIGVNSQFTLDHIQLFFDSQNSVTDATQFMRVQPFKFHLKGVLGFHKHTTFDFPRLFPPHILYNGEELGMFCQKVEEFKWFHNFHCRFRSWSEVYHCKFLYL